MIKMEIKTKKEIKKGETIFDRVRESVMRNDIIDDLQQRLKMTIETFTNKMNMLHSRIQYEKERLVNSNNEILDNLKMLEKKLTRKMVKMSLLLKLFQHVVLG